MRGYWDRRLTMVLSEHDGGAGGGGAGGGSGGGQGNGNGGGGAGNGDGGDGGEAWDETRARATITNLRNQERTLTRERTALQKKVDEYESASASETEKLQKRLEALETENKTLQESQRVGALRAQVANEATKAGAHNPDDVFALLNRDDMDIDDAGKVKNLASLVAGIRRDKPYLFSGRNVDAGAGKGGGQNGGTQNGNGGSAFNDSIRGAFGINR